MIQALNLFFILPFAFRVIALTMVMIPSFSDSSLIRLDCLEYHIWEELNKTAARTMVVLNPLKVVIANLEICSVMDLDAKKWPDVQTNDASSIYKAPFSNVVYIERTDFHMKDAKDYYGLAPGKSILLRGFFTGLQNLLQGLIHLRWMSGYFVADQDSTSEKIIFNRMVTLRDSYSKVEK